MNRTHVGGVVRARSTSPRDTGVDDTFPAVDSRHFIHRPCRAIRSRWGSPWNTVGNRFLA